jgi:hypothetical protein
MLKYTEEIYGFTELYDLLWGQAINVLDTIAEHDKEDDLITFLEEYFEFEDDLTLTTINDLLAYEWEYVFEKLDIEENNYE